jgi:tetracycline repressor-like protein
MSAELGLDDAHSGEAAQLLLSIIALCWFPMVHARTVAPAVGVHLEDVEELDRRKRHVIDLVLHGIRGRSALTTTSTEPSSHD